jgi:hypothetical protein
MIKVTVRLSNSYDSQYDEVVITKEEILQMAANKARGNYSDGHWTHISPDEEIKITLNG